MRNLVKISWDRLNQPVVGIVEFVSQRRCDPNPGIDGFQASRLSAELHSQKRSGAFSSIRNGKDVDGRPWVLITGNLGHDPAYFLRGKSPFKFVGSDKVTHGVILRRFSAQARDGFG